MSEGDSMSTTSSTSSDLDFAPPCDPNLNLELNSSWDVYFSRNDVENYDDRLVFLQTIRTIGDFWALYHYTKLPTYLRQGCDYMFFRSGIEPKWEAEENKNGGRLMVEIPKANRNAQLTDKWLETLLAVVGEQLSANPGDVTGAVVQSRRQQDRISVWTSTDGDAARSVGQNYQRLVNAVVKFQSHGNRTRASSLRYQFTIGAPKHGRTTSMDKKNASISGK